MSSTTYKSNFLKGKVAVITGGHSGMLFETAKQYLEFGASVTIMSRKIEKINDAVQRLKKESGSQLAFGVQVDVREPKSIQAAIDTVLKEQKRIDILINGAAGNFLASVEQLSFNAYKTVVGIDLIGTFNVTKIVYESWMKKNGGSIINIGAALYQNGVLFQSHAGSAKAGVTGLTNHFAVEFGPSKVRVNCITPGIISGTEGFDKLSDEKTKKMGSGITPLQRLGNVQDIAQACLFLASDASNFITAQNIMVDGGVFMTMPNFTMGNEQIRKLWAAPRL